MSNPDWYKIWKRFYDEYKRRGMSDADARRQADEDVKMWKTEYSISGKLPG